MNASPATEKQKYFLMSRSKWKDGMRKGEASDLIGKILDAEKKMTKEEYESYRACASAANLFPPSESTDKQHQG